jgi:hypothetical protein
VKGCFAEVGEDAVSPAGIAGENFGTVTRRVKSYLAADLYAIKGW